MAVFLVKDFANRSLCLLTATDATAAIAFADRFLPTADTSSISGVGLTAPQQAAGLQLCRMPPLSVPA